jgi:2OG-Fe(II) oxygenase superfamily
MERDMVITRHKSDIVVYDNFLTPEECAAIIKVLDIKMQKEELKWMPISFYESYSSGMPEVNDPDTIACGLPGDFFQVLRQRVIDATADMAGKKPEQMSQISWHSQRWAPGAFANMHSDNTDNEGKSGAFTRSRYATFIYLNDDFEDGVLNFKHGLTIVPKTGSMATFAGGFENTHEVTTVKKAIRYTLGSFWDDREESDYPQELRDAWATELAEVRAYQKTEAAEWEAIREEGLRITAQGEKYPAKEVE